MLPSGLKFLVPAMLAISFLQYTRSTNVLEVKCPDSRSAKSCPEYCPKDSRPEKVNPNSAWAVSCVCCEGVSRRTGLSGTKNAANEKFKLDLQPVAVKPDDVRKEDLDRLAKELEDLKDRRKIPRLVFEWWKVKVDQSQKHLLTKDEEELLVQLLVDCGIPLNTAILLVHPVVRDQSLPKPKDIGGPGISKRSGFRAKSFTFDDLKSSLQVLEIKEKIESLKRGAKNAAAGSQ